MPVPADAFAEMFFPRRDGFIKPPSIHARPGTLTRDLHCNCRSHRCIDKTMALSRIPLTVGFLGLLLFCASGAEAQSSNCADAKLANEVVICQTPRLSSRDRQMTYLVMHLRKPLSARQQQVLDAEQHSWRHALASCGKDVDCIADRYDQRIHQLLTVKCLDANRCAQW